MVVKQTTLDLNGPIIEFVQQPQSNEICPTGNSVFIGIATVTTPTVSTGTLSYRWYAEGHGVLSDGSFLGSTLTGTATTSLTVENAQTPTTNGVRFYLGVDYIPSAYSQPVGSAVTVGTARSTGNAVNEPLFSNRATLTVRPNIIINQEPSDTTVTTDQRATFSVSASLTNGTTSGLSYRWQLNGVDLNDSGTVSGSSTPTLSILQSTVGSGSVRVRISHPTACNSSVLSRSATFNILSARNVLNFESIVPGNSTATLTSWDLTSQGTYTYNLPSISSSSSSTFGWTEGYSGSEEFYDCIFANGYFYVVGSTGYSSYTGVIYRSVDGVSWTRVNFSLPGSQGITSIAYGNSRFVATSGTKLIVSTDGSAWTVYDVSSPISGSTITNINFGNGIFVATARDISGTTSIIISVDGLNWVPRFQSFSGQAVLSDAVYNGSFWLAVGFLRLQSGETVAQFFKSVDNGTTWNISSSIRPVQSASSQDYYKLQTFNDGTIAFGERVTTDGVNWGSIQKPGQVYVFGYSSQSNQLLSITGALGTGLGQYAIGDVRGNNWTYFNDGPFLLGPNGQEPYFLKPIYGNGKWIVFFHYIRGLQSPISKIVYSSGLTTISNNSLLSFYSPEKDVDVTLELYAEKGLDNGSFKGGEGGVSTIRFTARRNEEYVILGTSKSNNPGLFGGAIFLYRKGRLIAVCASGGNAGSVANGGSGGGVNVVGQNGFGSGGGKGGSLISAGTLSSTSGVWGSVSSNVLLSGDTRATVPSGGRTISCPKGDFWIRRGISPCSDVGSSQFVSGNGTVVTNTASIFRGFKEGYAIQETAGAAEGFAIGSLAGNGGQGATGGNGGTSGGGGGGGSGYTDGSVNIISTRQGGNSLPPKVLFKISSSATPQSQYSIFADSNFVFEGEQIKFNIIANNIANAFPILYWNVSPIERYSDFVNPVGPVQILPTQQSGIGTGSFTLTVSNDSFNSPIENESFSVILRDSNPSVGNIVATSDVIQIYDSSSTSQTQFTNPGIYSWVAPRDVTFVSVVAVGAGGDSVTVGSPGNAGWSAGGGGGGLGWKNNIPVVPGQAYTVVVGAAGYLSGGSPKGGDSYFISTSTVAGFGGGNAIPSQYYGSTVGSSEFYSPIIPVNIVGAGGTYVGDGGGNGGDGGVWPSGGESLMGGGGAGGYSGDGGDGGTYPSGGQNGSGGGGGGGASAYFAVSGFPGGRASSGGGVGIYGQGVSGIGASFNGGLNPLGGGGGSGGSSGPYGSFGESGGTGDFGAGAGLRRQWANRRTNGNGAVRIIWGPGRSFPSTNTGNL